MFVAMTIFKYLNFNIVAMVLNHCNIDSMAAVGSFLMTLSGSTGPVVLV